MPLDENMRKSRNDEHVANKFLSLVSSARSRGLTFNLELKDVRKLMSTNKCFYSGVELSKVVGAPNQHTIDRVDNDKGYVKGNVVACSSRMNYLKKDMNVAEIVMIYKGLKKKNII